jgi:carbonic anhydrase
MMNLKRRDFLQRSALTALTLATGSALTHSALAASGAAPAISDPEVALKLLVEGNLRFQRGESIHPNQDSERRTLVAAGQQPFAIIFGCSDSRESPELVFDRGLGDLFVARTAGHVLDYATLGSIEYGVAELHIPLIVVLGHERCGAVKATIETLEAKAKAPGSIAALVRSIAPAAEAAQGEGNEKLEHAIRLNTQNTARRLYNLSAIIRAAVQNGTLKIVGGRYDLDSGAMTLVPLS